MMRHRFWLSMALIGLVAPTMEASARAKYEVWAIDQSDSPGKSYGGTLYIWHGQDLENKYRAGSAPVEKIDLGGETAALCLANTAANPVRPHMLAINPAQTHAIISFVASGHVLFMDAAARVK